MIKDKSLSRSRIGAVLIGIGLGGFADGVLFHQILQWHQMLSTTLPPTSMEAMSINMLWGGYLLAFVWFITLIGLFFLWSAGQQYKPLPNPLWFVGWLLFGWGLFNFVESIISHHLLGLHHVRYDGDVFGAPPEMIWEIGFILVGGIGFMAIGWLLARFAVRNFARK